MRVTINLGKLPEQKQRKTIAEQQKEFLKDVVDYILLEQIAVSSSSRPEVQELIRRYNNKKEELRIYGGHCGGCPGRPCECGFKEAYEKAS